MSINGVCWPYPYNFHVLLCKWGQRCFIMSVMSFIIFVKMPLRSSPGSLRFFWLYFFFNSSLWELKCPVTLKTSKRHCCNFKDGLNSFFQPPCDRERLVYWHNAKSPARKMGFGGLVGKGGIGARSTTYSIRGWGGGDWEQEVGEHIWCIQNTNGHEKLSSPCELRMHVKQAHAKSQWLSIGKWLSHASLAGRAAVWNWESKGLNPDRGLPH